MRRLLASIALAGLAVVLTAPLAGAATSPAAMACCHGSGGRMICCAPSTHCEMKSCPPADRDAVLPGLPPAVLEPVMESAAMTPRPAAFLSSLPAAASLAADPPERPPRG